VWRIVPGEMVLARVQGPTMLDDLGRRPWRLRRHARTLADLHRCLHAIDAPVGLRAHPVPGTAVLHLDLHPGNVILSPDGPVVIDWTNAQRGEGAVDVAFTWIIMAASGVGPDELPQGGAARRLVAKAETRVLPWYQRRLTDAFLDIAGRDGARQALAAVAEQRIGDPNVRPGEAHAIRRLVAAETPAG
jgi:hypothetical protein